MGIRSLCQYNAAYRHLFEWLHENAELQFYFTSLEGAIFEGSNYFNSIYNMLNLPYFAMKIDSNYRVNAKYYEHLSKANVLPILLDHSYSFIDNVNYFTVNGLIANSEKSISLKYGHLKLILPIKFMDMFFSGNDLLFKISLDTKAPSNTSIDVSVSLDGVSYIHEVIGPTQLEFIVSKEQLIHFELVKVGVDILSIDKDSELEFLTFSVEEIARTSGKVNLKGRKKHSSLDAINDIFDSAEKMFIKNEDALYLANLKEDICKSLVIPVFDLYDDFEKNIFKNTELESQLDDLKHKVTNLYSEASDKDNNIKKLEDKIKGLEADLKRKVINENALQETVDVRFEEIAALTKCYEGLEISHIKIFNKQKRNETAFNNLHREFNDNLILLSDYKKHELENQKLSSQYEELYRKFENLKNTPKKIETIDAALEYRASEKFNNTFHSLLQSLHTKKMFKNKVTISNYAEIILIASSGFFDFEWYEKNFGEEFKLNKPIELLLHYFDGGWKIGCEPSSNFNGKQYLIDNPDVREEGINPLLHYVKYGVLESRVVVKID